MWTVSCTKAAAAAAVARLVALNSARFILFCHFGRCSTNQLESLATTLEPIFHRDFKTTLTNRYPSASFRTKARQPLHPIDHKKKKRKKPKPKRKASNVSTRNQTLNIIRSNVRITTSDVDSLASDNVANSSTSSVPRVPDIPSQNGSIARESEERVLPAVTKSSDYLGSNLTDMYSAEDIDKLSQEEDAKSDMTLYEYAGVIAETVIKDSLTRVEAELSMGHLNQLTNACDNIAFTGKPQTSSTSLFAKNNSTTARGGVKHVRIKENVLAKSLPLQVVNDIGIEFAQCVKVRLSHNCFNVA